MPLAEDWKDLAHKNVYAIPEYLEMLEKHGPLSYDYCYAIIYKDGTAVAALYFQKKRIELYKDFRLHSHSKNILKKIPVYLTRQAFRLVNRNLLIFGNVLLTGEYAYGINHGFKLEKELLDQVFKHVLQFYKQEKKARIHAILSKDFYESGIHKEHSFNASDFYKFKVQPDMILDIDPEWKNFDAYLEAVRSKYRVKFKKVIRQAEDLEFKVLELEDLENYNEKMYALYEATAKRALFSLFYLHPQYFLELKKSLGDNLTVTGIFKDSRLLGFYTFVKNQKKGDAHFIGYDVSLNSDYQIYFNILLGLIDQAIRQNCTYLNLSRTALEIKSSVGAEPHEMFIYLKVQNKLLNRILPFIMERVVPVNEWQPRSPFK